MSPRQPHTSSPPTSAASPVGERQRPVFAARPLQLAAVLVAPPIGAAHGLRLCPRADDAAVAIPVPDQPLGGERERERVSSVATQEAPEHTHKQTHTNRHTPGTAFPATWI